MNNTSVFYVSYTYTHEALFTINNGSTRNINEEKTT